MKKLQTTFLLIILVCIATAFAGVNILLNVSGGDSAYLSWDVSVDGTLSQQQKFSVQRKTNETDYSEIAKVTASNGIMHYTYVDKTAYKTSDVMYYYRIQLVDANAEFPYSYVYGSATGSAHLSISGVKKTWGSIKAMFR